MSGVEKSILTRRLCHKAVPPACCYRDWRHGAGCRHGQGQPVRAASVSANRGLATSARVCSVRSCSHLWRPSMGLALQATAPCIESVVQHQTIAKHFMIVPADVTQPEGYCEEAGRLRRKLKP